MSSSMISNPVTNTARSHDSRKKKKKKGQLSAHSRDQQSEDKIKWKSEAQLQIYSSKLLQALTQVRLSAPSPSDPRPGRSVREAADRVLAVAAKGRSRWSRAILMNRLKLKFRKQKRPRAAAVAASTSRSRKPKVSVLRLRGKNLPAVQRKVRVLGRLVPGCRKEPLPVILEEATDYIAALEMQVRAMSALAEMLSLSGSTASSSPTAPPPS